jgi:hypothetical protein
MPYHPALEKSIDDLMPEIVPHKKKMFGGICYLINGNMAFGIWMDFLIVRMSPDLAAEKLKERHVKAFDITGRPMRGWVMADEGAWKRRSELAAWLDIGKSFALSMPPKPSRKKSLEEIYYRNQKGKWLANSG